MVTVNVAVVAPAATVTLAGTVAAPLLLDSATMDPPVGATPFKVTVPVEGFPLTTLVGLNVKFESEGGLIVRVPVAVPPFALAVTVTGVEAATGVVVTVKVAVVAPAATVTLAGVLAEELSSDKVTTVPPVGEGPFKVTVPVEEVPPVTLAGLNVTVEGDGGLMVNVVV